MDISDYFVVVSTNDGVVHFQLKGFWSEKVAAEIGQEFVKQFKEAIDKMRGQKYFALVDVTEFKTPSPEANELLAQSMKYANQYNLQKAVEVLPSAVLKLSLKDAERQSGESGFRIMVSSVEEGWAEIDKMKKEL
jgi:hypothetical protein